MTEHSAITKEILWRELADAVVRMDEEQTITLAKQVLKNDFSPKEAILHGLTEGMRQVGEKFARKCYFVPEVLVCAETMYAGFDILKEHIPGEEAQKGTSVIIGVVEGDFHDIGKNIVALMLQTAGFIIHDLGYNVSVLTFLQKIREIKPDIVALSTLMSTTLECMREVVHAIRNEFADISPKIMVGGAPVSQLFAEQIRADFYGEDAQQAVIGAKQLMGVQ